MEIDTLQLAREFQALKLTYLKEAQMLLDTRGDMILAGRFAAKADAYDHANDLLAQACQRKLTNDD